MSQPLIASCDKIARIGSVDARAPFLDHGQTRKMSTIFTSAFRCRWPSLHLRIAYGPCSCPRAQWQGAFRTGGTRGGSCKDWVLGKQVEHSSGGYGVARTNIAVPDNTATRPRSLRAGSTSAFTPHCASQGRLVCLRRIVGRVNVLDHERPL